MSLLKTLVLGFIAGFLATLIFHQGLWYVLYQIHFIPADLPAWPLDPVPPLGVPSVISKAFWGGVWGAALAPLLDRYRGATYWASWILIGAVVLTLTALYVVPPLKGQPIPALWPRFYYALLVNGAWGFGTALFFRLAGAGRAQ
jgi:uncharacterized membrane protein YeaQ/YmgE (transglycosylase-associated protein family)